MGHWTPTGVEPKDYDDDDECYDNNETQDENETHILDTLKSLQLLLHKCGIMQLFKFWQLALIAQFHQFHCNSIQLHHCKAML